MGPPSSWILRGARVARGPDEAATLDLEIGEGKILALRAPAASVLPRKARVLELRGHLVLPGLINAHDHLEFNLFPRLGRGPYPNAQAWAREIYRPEESPVKEHLRIPQATRLLWGGLKNLLSGVTTVCHHNSCQAPILQQNFPVRVVKRFGWAHSLQFSPDLASRFHQTAPRWPFILHLGEATDGDGKREIFRLDEMGALNHRTVLVHAVALDGRGLRLAQKRGASLIWCPSSNLFLLGRTLGREVLQSAMTVALGTDSALSGKGDLLDELRLARRLGGLSNRDLYRMVTEQAARLLRLENGEGTLSKGGVADLVVVQDHGESPAAALFRLGRLGVEMVMVGGQVKLVSPSLSRQLPPLLRRRFCRLVIQQRRHALVDADVPKLYRQARRALGREIRLAGKRVCP